MAYTRSALDAKDFLNGHVKLKERLTRHEAHFARIDPSHDEFRPAMSVMVTRVEGQVFQLLSNSQRFRFRCLIQIFHQYGIARLADDWRHIMLVQVPQTSYFNGFQRSGDHDQNATGPTGHEDK